MDSDTMSIPDTPTTVKEKEPTQVIADSLSDFPEGGLAGWATVAGA